MLTRGNREGKEREKRGLNGELRMEN